MEILRAAVSLIVRSMVLSAQSAGQQRLLSLTQAIAGGETAGELARLRDENRRLKSENRLLRARLDDAPVRKRYTPWQRLQIIWHMAYYGIPRNQVPLSTASETVLSALVSLLLGTVPTVSWPLDMRSGTDECLRNTSPISGGVGCARRWDLI